MTMRGVALLLAFLLGCSANTSTLEEQTAGPSGTGIEEGLAERDRSTQEPSAIQRPPPSQPDQPQIPESIDKGMMFDALERDQPPMSNR